MRPKILFADRRPMSDESLVLLRKAGELMWAEGDAEQELIEAIKDVSIVISGQRPITGSVICAAPQLKAVIAYGVGYDHVDVEVATERGVYVVNAHGVNAVSVAELVIGLMITMARKIPLLDANVKAGHWDRWEFLGNELYGKTLGIVGLGVVGGYLASLAKAFQIDVLSFTKNPSTERAKDKGVKFVALNRLFEEADFIVICCELTDETRNLIGTEEIALLKSTAYFINVGRGPIVDEKALAVALKKKKISGAALDVFDIEPPEKNNPLLGLDNVVLTSHIAGLSDEAMKRLQMVVAEESVRILNGKEPENQVNRC